MSNFVSNEDANTLFGKVGERLGLRPKTFTGTHDQWDQLTELQQAEYEYVNFTDDYAAGSMIFKRTLAAGATTVTVEDPSITAEVMIDVYADVFGVAPTNESVSNGVLTLTFPAQQSAVNLKIVVSGNPDKGGHGGGLMPHLIIHATSGSTVTVTAETGGTVITAEETSSGIFECDLPDYGRYVVSDGTSSNVITVNTVAIYTVYAASGSTVLPTDDISIWLSCGGRLEQYTTLDEILADQVCLSALLNSNNAVDYMVRSTTFADKICSDELAMSFIGLNNRTTNILINDEDWLYEIAMSDYIDYVLNGKVPAMTSNSTPEGLITCGTQASGESQYAFRLFDGNINTWNCQYAGQSYNTVNPSSIWDQYEFIEPVIIKAFRMQHTSSGGYGPSGLEITDFKIQASNDGSNYTDVKRFSGSTYAANQMHKFAIDNDQAFTRWKYQTISGKPIFCEMQFYYRIDV